MTRKTLEELNLDLPGGKIKTLKKVIDSCRQCPDGTFHEF